MGFSAATVQLDPWLVLAPTAAVVVLVGIVAWTVMFAVLRRVLRFSVVLSTLIESVSAPGRVVIPLVLLQLLWAAAPVDLPALHGVTITTALMLIGALTWLGTRAVRGLAAAVLRLHPANVGDNLEARRIQTQTNVLSRTVSFFVLLIGIACALMVFPGVRQIGASLLASAGVAGLVAGIAARPVLSSLIAGLQIALTQPIRLDDVVIIEGEWGRIEEITATYVVVKVWDQRRLIVPLQWVIEHPFQNWTRRESELLGSIMFWLDFSVPLAPLRTEVERLCAAAPEWDGRVALLQVVDTSERAMQVRVLVSAADAAKAWDLRCRVREGLIDYLQREHPAGLPRIRAEIDEAPKHAPRKAPAPPPERPGKGDTSSIRHAEHAGQHGPELPKTDGARVAEPAPRDAS